MERQGDTGADHPPHRRWMRVFIERRHAPDHPLQRLAWTATFLGEQQPELMVAGRRLAPKIPRHRSLKVTGERIPSSHKRRFLNA